MRNMLALVGAAVVTVVGLGWYLDWFHVHRTATEAGSSSYNVQVNKKKISEDLHKGENKLQGMIEKKLDNRTPAAEGSAVEQTSNLEPPQLTLPSQPGPAGGSQATEGPDLVPPGPPAPEQPK